MIDNSEVIGLFFLILGAIFLVIGLLVPDDEEKRNRQVD